MIDEGPEGALRSFFLGDDSHPGSCPSLEFLERHPSLLRDLGRVLQTPDPSEHPQSIGHYRVTGVLGRGAMGEVLRALDTVTGEPVALKVVPAADRDAAAALEREAVVLGRLHHPNVVRCLDSGCDDDWCWLALELVDGKTLADWIEEQAAVDASCRGSGRIRLVMSWLRDLAGGLAALHDAGSIHRDIKPANVLIREDDSVLLIDFGLSQPEAAESWGVRVLAGTIPYMSPEQTLAGLVAIDRTSDVYSLAATIYEALSGDRIVAGGDRSNLLLDVAFGQVPSPSRRSPYVPLAADAIFSKALAKKRERRYSDARLLAEDAAAFLRGAPLVHAAIPLPMRLAYLVRRRRRSLLVIAAGLFGVLVAWGFVLQHRHADRQSLLADLERLRVAGTLEAEPDLVERLEQQSVVAAVASYCREHATDLAQTCAYRTMLELGFFVAGATDLEGVRKRAAFAAAVDAVAPRPGFLFVICVRDFLEQGPEVARDFLLRHRQRVDNGVLLLELLAVLELEAGNVEAYADLAEELASKSTARQQLASVAFRAYRHVRVAATTRARPSGLLPDRRESLAAARQWADLATASGMQGPFGSTCLGLVAMEEGDFAAAEDHFVAVADVDRERRGAELYSILTGLLRHKELRADYVDRVARVAAALAVDRGLVMQWLTRQAYTHGQLSVANRIATAMEPVGAQQTERAATLGFLLVYRSAEASAWEDCGALADVMVDWLEADSTRKARKAIGDAYALGVWSGIHRVRERRADADFDRNLGLAWLHQTRERCAVALARGFGAALDAHAARAICDLLSSRCVDGDERRRLELAGREAANRLLQDETIRRVADRDPSTRQTLAFLADVVAKLSD